MCLAIPGKIIAIINEDPLMREGKVNFGGVVKNVNLAFVPEAMPGDYVIVHVGVAISLLDEKEALQIFEDLKQIQALDDSLGESQ